MKNLGILPFVVGLMLLCSLACHAQTTTPMEHSATQRTTTLKLNMAYAIVGVINPQVEFRLTPHSAFQTEFVYSPWQSLGGHPMHFGIFLNEYRYYISERTKGLYVGAHAGMMAFDMSKPYLNNGALDFQKRYLF